MKRNLLLLIIVIIFAFVFVFISEFKSEYQGFENKKTNQIDINGTVYNIEIASTDTEKAQGLSDLTSLDKSSGMLFLFNPPMVPSFWMRQMNFPLDIVWIRNSNIVDLSNNLPVPKKDTDVKDLPTYMPKGEVDSVLEINAGEISAHNFKIGDIVKLN